MTDNTLLKLTFALLLFSLIALTIPACQSQKSSDSDGAKPDQEASDSITKAKTPVKTTYHIDFPLVINQKKEILLSDIAHSIRYVALETTTKYLIGEKAYLVKPSGEYIFIGEHKKPVGVFDLNGNFLHTIGTVGKGPGEFNFDYNYWPDAEEQKLYIQNTNIKGITVYSFQGEYLGDIITDPYGMVCAPIGDKMFISWNFRQDQHDDKFYRIKFHNDKGSIEKRIFEEEINLKMSGGIISINSPLLTYAPEGILYNSWEDNKIMRATADGSFEPALSWTLGKYELPFKPSSDFKRYDREKHKYLLGINAWESHEFFYLKFNFKSNLELAVFNKQSEEFFIVENPDRKQEGIYNDIDGGPSFWPFWYSDKGERFFELFQSIDLLDGELSQKSKLEPKDENAAKTFQELLSTLNEDSNPVLMIVEMK